MRVVFLGTPEFAVPALERLAAARQRGIELVAAICQPDRPTGRGLHPRAPAVRVAAERLGIAVYQPERIRSDAALEWLEQQQPDALAVVAYGQILPASVFARPRYGAINAHASLLPKYRGAAPIQWALARGETKTGVTTMQIDAGMDTGAMLLRSETPIGPDETAPEVAQRLAAIGAELLVETLLGLERGAIVPQPQDGAQASTAPLLKKENGLVDWSRPAREIYDRWRGFQPWPGLQTRFRGHPLRLVRVRPGEQTAEGPQAGPNAPPGRLTLAGGHLYAACGQGALRLDDVQLEGRKAVGGADFAHGARLEQDEKLE